MTETSQTWALLDANGTVLAQANGNIVDGIPFVVATTGDAVLVRNAEVTTEYHFNAAMHFEVGANFTFGLDTVVVS